MNAIKSLRIFAGLIFAVIILSGCSSTMKCYVEGVPQTKIYTPEGKFLGSIQESGFVKIEIDREDKGHDFLIAQQTPESPIIPLGLNYSKRHNEFRAFAAGLFSLPSVGISAVSMALYLRNWDVNDQLKLKKDQKSNDDLVRMVLQSPNPADEILADMSKNKKSKKYKDKRKNKINAELINQTGKFERVKSFSIINSKNDSRHPLKFKGIIIFNFTEDFGNSIKIKGEYTNTNEPLEITIRPEGEFKNRGDKYIAENAEGGNVIIYCSDNGNYCMTFDYSPLTMEIEFDPESFVETEPELDEKDVYYKMLKVLKNGN